MGKFFLTLFAISLSQSLNAAVPDGVKIEKPRLQDMFAHVDYERETIVVTANVMNKQVPEQYRIVYGGRFSPSATAYLKPLSNFPVKAFVQVRCLDLMCTKMAVYAGVRNGVGNPYAYNEQKFVLFKNGLDGIKDRFQFAGR